MQVILTTERRIPAALYRSIEAKSKRLFADGYRSEDWLYGYVRMTGGAKPYIVAEDGSHCECECFGRYKVCKHSLGVGQLKRDQDRRLHRLLTPERRAHIARMIAEDFGQ